MVDTILISGTEDDSVGGILASKAARGPDFRQRRLRVLWTERSLKGKRTMANERAFTLWICLEPCNFLAHAFFIIK